MDGNRPFDNNRRKFTSPNPFKRVRDNQDDTDGRPESYKKTTNQKPQIQPIERFDFIKKLNKKHSDETDYMLARPWFVKWERFCFGLTENLPTEIDNSTLLLEDGSLKPGLVLDTDYVNITEKGWHHLVQWYGLRHPSFALPQPKTKTSITKPIHKPRVLPKSATLIHQIIGDREKPIVHSKYYFKVYEAGSSSTQRSHAFTISPNSTVSEFQTSLLNALDLTSGTQNIELWLLNIKLFTSSFSKPYFIEKPLLDNTSYAIYIDPSSIDYNSTIEECLAMTPPSFTTVSGKNDHHYYYLAVDFINNKKKRNTTNTSLFSLGSSSTTTTSNPPGLYGLMNLGNTCYMNSALQCLSNTPQLTKWFLSGEYKKNINTTNPLGLNGELAESFADVIRAIWNNHSSVRPSISPKEFKNTFERFNPHFVGYQQQDSQELISFLLDGLHEDLNRILKKPYMEIPDFDDELSDKEVATCFWNYHKARNDSIIVDLFQGQFKSRLTCDECKKVSVTFDPFMYLSLPLPADTKYEIDVVYVPYLPSQRQLKMTIHLNKDAKIGHLKQEIENNVISSSLSISNDHSLLVAEMHQGKIFKLFTDADQIYSIRPSDTIYVYQLPCPSTAKNDEDWVIFPVYCATTIDMEQQLISSSQFGFPIVLAIETKNLGDLDGLYGTIVHHIERYCIVKLFEEDDSYTAKTESEQEKPDKTEEEEVEEVEEEVDLLYPHYQQPIHTTAAVTPAGGRPMVPMPNLFNIKIFGQQNKSIPLSKSRLNFPTGSSVYWLAEPNDDGAVLKQGQGILIEWSVSKAQQVFGSKSSSTRSIYDHDHHSDINTEAWREYEELISNTTTKRTYMTTRSSSQSTSQSSTLEDCLNEFTGDERLSSEDLWYCPRCKKHQRASKKFDIWRLPEIMVVHLKRFSQVRRWGNKIDSFIDFPIEGLDMTDRVLSSNQDQAGVAENERLIYDLYAVDNHYGGMGGGHYTTYAQNIQNKVWYNFDDSHVNKLSLKDIKSNAAYLLFYKRRR